MAAVTSLSFSALTQSSSFTLTSARNLGSNSDSLRLPTLHSNGFRQSNVTSRFIVQCTSSITSDSATVADTKTSFLKAYKRPKPSVYNTVLQELIVQQHLTRYKRTYRYDSVFALGVVTVYDKLMDGYPSEEDKDTIFKAYVNALKEDPEQYTTDAKNLEEWAEAQTSTSLIEFPSKEGEVEGELKDIADRAGKGSLSYSRFFAVGLFRILELATATEPTVLEKLCASLNIEKTSVDRDLDVYRNLLSKLVQAKELLKEYVAREKKKREERVGTQTANGAMASCVAGPQSMAL